MNLGLKNKRVLVTGASSGLGAAAARSLSDEGAEVLINSRNQSRLEKAADAIEKETGSRPRPIAADISNAEDVARLISQVGPVDILVSNCGGPPPAKLSEVEIDNWRSMADLILYSAIGLTRALIDGMVEREFGRLIYITSIGMLQPIDDLIFSNTFRAGLAGFCKTVSNNYASHGITANCVCPGFTATERLWELANARAEGGSQTPEEVMDGFSATIPAGRLGKPDELAALIAFLASDQAGYITGTAIPVDGGMMKSLI